MYHYSYTSHVLVSVILHNIIKTHGSVSAAKKDARAQVCYLRDRSSSRFQPIITQKLWRLFLLILHILMSPYTAPYIPNLRGIAPAVPEIRAPETCRIFFVFFFFFFFAPDDKYVRKQSSRAANTMKFGTLLALPKPYISIKFGTITGNIDENMTDSR